MVWSSPVLTPRARVSQESGLRAIINHFEGPFLTLAHPYHITSTVFLLIKTRLDIYNRQMKTTYWLRETYPGENVILSYFFCFFKKGAGCCITIQKKNIYIYIYKLVYPKSFWNAKIEIGRVPHEVPQYLRLFIRYQKISQSLGGEGRRGGSNLFLEEEKSY